MRLLPRQHHLIAQLFVLRNRPARGWRGRSARADRPPAQGRSTPRGCSSARQRLYLPLLPRTIGVITGESGKARDDILAALPVAAGPDGSSGASPGAGSPRGARDHPRPGRSRRRGRGRGGDRRSRRRLAGRPALLLRRDPLPHGRAARGAGDRLGRPSHRPYAARRCRCRQLLDTTHAAEAAVGVDCRRARADRGDGARLRARLRRPRARALRVALARAACFAALSRRAPAEHLDAPARSSPPEAARAPRRLAPAVCRPSAA